MAGKKISSPRLESRRSLTARLARLSVVRNSRPSSQELWSRAMEARHCYIGCGPRAKSGKWERLRLRLLLYLRKMRGSGASRQMSSWDEVGWSFLGSFLGVAILLLVQELVLDRHDQALVLGSFGASVFLVFGAPHAPFSQPRNVIGSHVLSALVGVFAQQHFGATPWLAAALAVSLATAVMFLTATMHPPGGATALIAVVGGPELKSLGYWYALMPCGFSMLLMVILAVIINNMSRRRHYPLYWW